MKKILLSASLLMVSAAAFAATDGQTYEPKNGLTCENLWIFDRHHTPSAFAASTIAGTGTRTATTDGEVIYIGNSSNNPATIEKFNVSNGEYLGALQVKLADGTALSGTLCVNQVGFDEAGNFYAATYSPNADGVGDYKVYVIDLSTGIATPIGVLPFDQAAGRVDYCDVIGDLTGKTSGATVLAVASNVNRNVFNWRLEKGQGGADVEWQPGWDDGSFSRQANTTYPVDKEGNPQAAFNTGSMVKMVRPSDDGKLDLFYIDGNTTTANLYDSKCTMIDSFGEIPAENGVPSPDMGPNGVVEAVVGNQNLFAYALNEYGTNPGGQAVLCSMNADMEYSSMKPLWTVPADNLGQEKNAGARIKSYDRIVLDDDANGKHAILFTLFNEGNGLAVYRIAEEGYQPQGGVADNSVAAAASIRVNGDVIAVSEVAESIEVYNVAGQKVAQVENASEIAAPVNGVYFVKAVVAGAPVVAKVIVK